MLNLLKNKKNLVFVGGFAMQMHGLKYSHSDIDVVVTDLEDLEGAKEFKTNSVFSPSGDRAVLFKKDYKIDIFIEPELPEWELLNGYKCQTVHSMLKYYESFVGRIKIEDLKDLIIEKINTLKSWEREKI